MKKSFLRLLTVILIIGVIVGAVTVNVFAATGSTSFSISGTKNVGETISVNFRFTHPEKIAYIKASLTYDAKMLEFESAEGAMANGSSGVILFNVNNASFSESVSVKFNFKVNAAGSSYIGIKDDAFDLCYNAEESEITFNGAGATLQITDKTATKSSDANLKYITPSAGSLTPKFSPNVTSYTITIPNSATTLTVGAGTSHSGADWDVEGSKEMKVGSNQRVIIVTAEDGTQKKYTLNITRLAEDGSASEPTTSEPDASTETVTVTADGKDMVISGSFDTTNLFPGYSVNTYVYNGVEFPCIEKDDTKLLYLTDTNGENGGFYRPLEDGSFECFAYMLTKVGFYEFLKPAEIPEGYSEIALNIDSQKVTAYQSSDPTVVEFALIYAKGPEGYEGFYRYDTLEHTLQRAVGAIVTVTDIPQEEDNNTENSGSVLDNFLALDMNSKIIAVAIVGIILLLIVAIIVLIVKIARPSVYEEEYEEEETEESNEIGGFEFISISDRDNEEETIE